MVEQLLRALLNLGQTALASTSQPTRAALASTSRTEQLLRALFGQRLRYKKTAVKIKIKIAEENC